MVVTLVHVTVKPGATAQFIEASRINHQNSIQEPGNRRFDILQDPTDETRFLLYEAYDSVEAAAAHKETSHYLAWRDAVADLMAEPRRGAPFTVLCPE